HIGAARHGHLAKLHNVRAARYFFPDGLVRIERVAALIDIAHHHGLADFQRAAIWLFLTGEHSDESGLARTVRPDHTDNAARRQLEGKIVDQQTITKALGDAVGLIDVATKTRPRRNDDLGLAFLLLACLGKKVLIGIDTRLGLCLTRLRALPDPFKFAGKCALPG